MAATPEFIDVVIPLHRKDLKTLPQCLIHAKRFTTPPVRRLIIVSSERPVIDMQNVSWEWVDERIFPFQINDIRRLVPGTPRPGWILQNLLKLYAVFVIPNISDDILVLDSDTVLLKSISFYDADGRPLYNYTNQYYAPFFTHLSALLPGLKRVYPDKSGITHHMLLQKKVLQEIFNKVEDIHSQPLWIAFLQAIPEKERTGYPVSEFELYFNYVLQFHPDAVAVRPLKFADSCNRWNDPSLDYISCHDYVRRRSFIMILLLVFLGVAFLLLIGMITYLCLRNYGSVD